MARVAGQNDFTRLQPDDIVFVKDPREVVSPGDRVTVRVLEVKLDKNQIALRMKSARGQERASNPAPTRSRW